MGQAREDDRRSSLKALASLRRLLHRQTRVQSLLALSGSRRENRQKDGDGLARPQTGSAVASRRAEVSRHHPRMVGASPSRVPLVRLTHHRRDVEAPHHIEDPEHEMSGVESVSHRRREQDELIGVPWPLLSVSHSAIITAKT